MSFTLLIVRYVPRQVVKTKLSVIEETTYNTYLTVYQATAKQGRIVAW